MAFAKEQFAYEFANPFDICFDLFEKSFVFIYSKKLSFFENIHRSFLIVCCFLFYLCLFVKTKDIFSGGMRNNQLVYLVPILVICTQSILKVVLVLPRKNKIKNIILDLGISWRMNNLTTEQIIKKTHVLEQLNFFNKAFYWFAIPGAWQYMLVPLMETLFQMFILKKQPVLKLPFYMSFPFDPFATWTRYICVYTFQCYAMIHVVYIYMGSEFLMIILCSHLSTEFILLQEDIRQVIPQRNSLSDVTAYDDAGLKDIIIKHQRLIMLTRKLNEIFNEIIFMNLLTSTITACFFGVVAVQAHGLPDIMNSFVGVGGTLLPIFNVCYYGELLTGASAGVADAAYQNLWYEGNLKFQEMFIFMIMRSQQPCSLTSLKFAPVSFNTFTKVLSSTWTYFSVAMKMYEEPI